MRNRQELRKVLDFRSAVLTLELMHKFGGPPLVPRETLEIIPKIQDELCKRLSIDSLSRLAEQDVKRRQTIQGMMKNGKIGGTKEPKPIQNLESRFVEIQQILSYHG
jgi:hypothetical protein